MKSGKWRLVPPMLALCAWAPAGNAQDGLVTRAVDWLWPQVQARITVQTAALTPVTLARAGEPAHGRSVYGGALLGDFVFARPSFGSFRATSGLVLGAQAGAPVATSSLGPRLGLTWLDAGQSAPPSADAPAAMPYLGFGYASPSLWGNLTVSADFGLVSARPSGLAGVGRALLGNQAFDGALRELRLAPLLQFGVRYSF